MFALTTYCVFHSLGDRKKLFPVLMMKPMGRGVEGAVGRLDCKAERTTTTGGYALLRER